MEHNNSGAPVKAGGLILGLGAAIGYAIYTYAKKKARMELEKEVIDITPKSQNREEPSNLE